MGCTTPDIVHTRTTEQSSELQAGLVGILVTPLNYYLLLYASSTCMFVRHNMRKHIKLGPQRCLFYISSMLPMRHVYVSCEAGRKGTTFEATHAKRRMRSDACEATHAKRRNRMPRNRMPRNAMPSCSVEPPGVRCSGCNAFMLVCCVRGSRTLISVTRMSVMLPRTVTKSKMFQASFR